MNDAPRALSSPTPVGCNSGPDLTTRRKGPVRRMAMPRLPCVTHGDIARAILIAIVGVLLGAPVIVSVIWLATRV
jgi:hypothetical protein